MDTIKKKRILIVGAGGRCHALARSIAKSPHAEKIFCAPGNAGIASVAECVPLKASDITGLADFAQENDIDLTIVGPEQPLADGIADEFQKRGLPIFAPSREAAKIESSKLFAKEIMEAAGIPTASFSAFTSYPEALAFIKSRSLPAVIKYDGLAAGKGVVVARTYDEAEEALAAMLVERRFGQGKVLIEDYIEGTEFSFMCFVNGSEVYPLEVARDHKRAFDGDRGPNTGGMGAYSPVPFVTSEVFDAALHSVMVPAARELEKRGTPFLGVLYGGLILTSSGVRVIEFNARFGDPETEVVLPRLESDILEFIDAVMERRPFTPVWSENACLGIVLAAKGYPLHNPKGLVIGCQDDPSVSVFHMATRLDADGTLLSDGGRVLMVTAKADSLTRARQHALGAIELLAKPGGFFYRKDIGNGIILDGLKLAAEIKGAVASGIRSRVERGFRRPGLALVLAGDDPGSAAYVSAKARDAAEVGIEARTILKDSSVSREELLDLIHSLNADPSVDGIMVQLPLPGHIDEAEIIAAIDPAKDSDGFTPQNVAALWTGREGVVPCTPKGIMKLLRANDIRIAGKHAVVIGRSNIVGLPVSRLLLDANATVTMAHSMTSGLKDITRRADILIVAAGSHSLVTGDMIKPGAVVIDVGINRNPETGKVQGDTVFESCRPVASAITPVPGGVGPLTKACLMENVFEAYEKSL